MDPEYFEQLAMPLFDQLYNFAHWLTGAQADAEDLVQEAYLRACRAFNADRILVIEQREYVIELLSGSQGDRGRPALDPGLARTGRRWARRAASHQREAARTYTCQRPCS